MSISSELLTLNNTKTAIRTAINNKGGSVSASDTFASYADAITNLPSGGSGNPLLKSIDVSDFTGVSFDGVASYITDVTIPSGVRTIGMYAFRETGLTTITIPSSVTTISSYTFYQSKLTSITIPSTVRNLGQSVFQYCTNLTSITLPNNITVISSGLLSGCSSLTNCTIPETVTTIQNTAFENCGLTTIIIPSSVTTIGYGVFQGCTRLTSVIVNATTPPTLDANAFNNTNNCPIYVPAASVDAYKAATKWSTYASRIYPITQLATVDGNPVYNYELGNIDSTTILSTELVKMPTGTSIEFAEGITNIGGSISGYTTVTLPSTFATFNDQNMIGSSVTTLTMKSTTPPTAERNNFGGAGLTVIYVPASAVDTYKAASGWSNFASIIEGISSPSITIVKYIGQSNPADIGEYVGCNGTLQIDAIPAASENSTFDSDIKASGLIIVEDNNGNDVTSQCTFSSNDYYKWDTSQDPSYDGESPVQYFWVLDTDIGEADAQNPRSTTITATYGNLSDTFTIEWTTTSNCEEPEPDPEEPEE